MEAKKKATKIPEPVEKKPEQPAEEKPEKEAGKESGQSPQGKEEEQASLQTRIADLEKQVGELKKRMPIRKMRGSVSTKSLSSI